MAFDDPTVYDIHAITDDMTDEEKKEIYCVSSFPKDDLHDLIAGTPPNKDFSNAVKPNNQVQAHTFASYLDGYLRPLKEEDIGFLNERVSLPTRSYPSSKLMVEGRPCDSICNASSRKATLHRDLGGGRRLHVSGYTAARSTSS